MSRDHSTLRRVQDAFTRYDFIMILDIVLNHLHGLKVHGHKEKMQLNLRG